MKLQQLIIPSLSLYLILSCQAMFADSPSDSHASLEAKCKEKGFTAALVPPKMIVQEKKIRFRCLIQPALNSVFLKLESEYESTKAVNDIENQNLIKQMNKYKVKTKEDLLKAIKPHPRSIALAQAAMESAWGTSRFFREANNIFGVWSFNKNEPRIAAGKKRGDKTIWVKKYPSIEASIEDYYLVLAKGRAFSEFRSLKMQTSDPYQLVKKLDRYSERKAEYGKELASMIRYNKFFELD